ncbi:MAG TPA: hypothetical protein VJU83_04340 [Burkholderiales bacterium]|nr:hypothetical protein [Burkholderiales bacterium]
MKSFKQAMIVAALGLAFGGSAAAADNALSKEEYKSSKDRIEADYKAAKDRCNAMKDNAKDICEEEAKGNEKIAKAELEARNENTDRARRKALEAKVEAQYEIAKEKCDDLKGNAKDVCIKDAKAVEQRAKADITANMSGATGASVSTDDRKDAREDAKDAQYTASKERCDSMSGDAKDRCVADVKARYGK